MCLQPPRGRALRVRHLGLHPLAALVKTARKVMPKVLVVTRMRLLRRKAQVTKCKEDNHPSDRKAKVPASMRASIQWPSAPERTSSYKHRYWDASVACQTAVAFSDSRTRSSSRGDGMMRNSLGATACRSVKHGRCGRKPMRSDRQRRELQQAEVRAWPRKPSQEHMWFDLCVGAQAWMEPGGPVLTCTLF